MKENFEFEVREIYQRKHHQPEQEHHGSFDQMIFSEGHHGKGLS